ncbi:hypothetical protein EMIHUDRAFT_225692 [Emiliania huxleyi CCMP1516]|uniref:glutamate synthase (ferredoxin) n=2 Tax=Emiliania huxleyi TaxID=2903 RepID=A0A0D3KNC3_EMIH1|nr:hypothetical protein EMIHUDRAFT_225692 [Emiliania huxleyi CCMP1516]EOD37258.1 hypothetical protein EMIHUDRAFT_225692 [Emiliania huxleyi CCMP1516]|eukprot:XP_005789687.1 hypothetical protein EMIHUDRAFT_225692 [Emiliania huxleyi CCMP1516]
MPLVGERDACGVGFLADTKGRNNHDIIARALHALSCMEHRGGCGGDRVSGDGAGVMTAVPWGLFEADGSLGGKPADSMGVAMAFLPQQPEAAQQAQHLLETQAALKGFEVVGWREADLLEHAKENPDCPVGETYFASLSSRTIVYKGMVQSAVLGRFYGDLTDERYTTNFAIYHRRFSTNTVPKWPLAQPMRCLAHNGEINTLIGNVNWQRALDVQRGRRDPLCSDTKSDSANLDSVFENAIRGTGKQPVLALSALVPEAYRDQPAYDDHPEVTAMLDYYAGLQEPWDGPALLTFCDGTQLGAQLDRNGLRPARFLETKDGLVAFMSETGVVEVDDADVVRKGRLGPGNCITINLATGEFKTNLEVKKGLAAEAPYSEWMAAKAKKVPYRDEFAVECEAEVPPGLVQQMTAFGGRTADLTFVPPLLAVGAVHHHLIRAGLRMRASILVETAQAWSTHHIACLVGYGASAVHPYMLWSAVRFLYESDKSAKMREQGKLNDISLRASLVNTRKALEAGALEAGVLKILSKIGISLLSSYHGAQIFEAIGIGEQLVETAFRGTPSRVGGLTPPELAEERLLNYGFVKFYAKKEHHENTPPMSKMLHKALDSYEAGDWDKGRDQYKLFNDAAIMRRFATGGMSLGALSREAHETLAMGVNRAGARSNSGEGGEDEARWTAVSDSDDHGNSPSWPHLKGLQDGDIASSKIKQVASGRFGVTPAYLMSAEQIEIKIAQGAKPGEGGQLPGAKVNAYIASIRACKEGVMLISPPPHHDIYSIEDLAQLIYDLHQINPQAKVSVKLVGQISGADGGTGASPLTSIKHAGGPWELGLAESHQALLLNNLRDRVVLRVDGGLKTGYDVVMGALLGADEFGFGTIAMIAVGCVVARICHTNNCPVGVTTQKEALRRKFVGVPHDMLGFFVLAHLGYASFDEIIGRADLLRQRERPLHKTANLDLGYVGQMPDVRHDRAWQPEVPDPWAQTDTLDDELLAREDIKRAIEAHEHVTVHSPITNTDRTATARVTGEIAKAHGNRGWRGSIHFVFEGCAGQSFGFACLDGLDLEVCGDANDYVGKSMHGGRIRIHPIGGEIGFEPSESVIVGNTCLYGATGGRFFAAGRAGERFCVRNSNAEATGGWGYFLEEGEGYSLAPRINRDVQMQRAHLEATGSQKAKAILDDWEAALPKFWHVFPSSEAKAPELGSPLSAVPALACVPWALKEMKRETITQ